MSRAAEDTAFTCAQCGRAVVRHPAGSYRNHCPWCLFSRHVDVSPGDRASTCLGLMTLIGLEHSGKKGFVLLHRCERCGHVDRNKAAPDDDVDRLIEAARETP